MLPYDLNCLGQIKNILFYLLTSPRRKTKGAFSPLNFKPVDRFS